MKEKCPYCDYSDFEDSKDLALTKIDLNYLELRASTWLSCNRTDISNGYIPRLMIDVSLISNDDEVVGQLNSIPANYCPICGRYLLEDAPEQQEDTNAFNGTSIYELCINGELSARCSYALIRSGIVYLEDLSYIRDVDLKNLKNIGKKAYECITKLMDNHGVMFAECDMIKDKIKTIGRGKQIEYIDLNYLEDSFEKRTCYLRNICPVTMRHNTYMYGATVADSAESTSSRYIYLYARDVISIKEVIQNKE